MRQHLILPLALLCAAPAAAQIVPLPDPDTPRIQHAQWQAGETVLLTALPNTPLTVLLEPGDEITRITMSDAISNKGDAWAVKVSSEYDSFTLLPDREAQPATLQVKTVKRSYAFRLQTGNGIEAAHLVRLTFPTNDGPAERSESHLQPGDARWSYRLRGDNPVRPADIFDDGAKTWIAFGKDQPLPAVFAIGPSGDEQVVNGYMRGSYFVIDRVHDELIFRIDKEKASAERQSGKGQG